MDDDAVLAFNKRFPFLSMKNTPNTAFGISFSHPDHSDPFSIEETTSLLFSHLKNLVRESTKMENTDYVITVPSYFDVFARQAILDAADLADIKVVGLMNEVTAAALNYALSIQWSEDQKFFIFFHIGHSSTTASVITYSLRPEIKGQDRTPTMIPVIEVLETQSDPQLGGAFIDLLIRDHFISIFKTQHPHIDLENPQGEKYARLLLKMTREANNAKFLLTVSDQVKINIDNLLENDVSFTYVFTRLKMEEILQPHLDNLLSPLKSVMERAGLSPSQHDFGIVFFGGISRIPCLIETVRLSFAPAPILQNIDIDEAIALGACLRAAMLSKRILTKHIVVIDRSIYSSFISQESEPAGQMLPLFSWYSSRNSTSNGLPPGHARKRITLPNKTTDFDMHVFIDYLAPKDVYERRIHWSTLSVHGIDSVLQLIATNGTGLAQEPSVSIVVSCDPSTGLPVFEKLKLIVSLQSVGVVDGDNSTESSQPISMEYPLTFTENKMYPSVDDDRRNAILNRRSVFDEFRKQAQRLARAHNDLEEILFDLRSDVHDNTKNRFMDPDIRKKLEIELDRISKKLDDDGYADKSSALSMYLSDYNKLKELSDPYRETMRNYMQLSDAVDGLKNGFQNISLILEMPLSDLNETETEEISSLQKELAGLLETTRVWLAETEKRQTDLPLYSKPVLYAIDVSMRTKDLEALGRLTSKKISNYIKLRERLKREEEMQRQEEQRIAGEESLKAAQQPIEIVDSPIDGMNVEQTHVSVEESAFVDHLEL